MYRSQEDFFDHYWSSFPIRLDEENLNRVREFVLEMWIERAREMGLETPVDLTGSCKFSALFGSVVFGADIAGNYDHVFNLIDGEIVDVNRGSADVRALDNPYRHDDNFITDDDFQYSMGTCVPRVEKWIEEYIARYDLGADPHRGR